MVSRITGAFVRLVLIMFLIALPSMLLESSPDTRQMVALLALFAGALTFVEYASLYPSLIEFRDAPPFNRLRYLSLFLILLALSLLMRDDVVPSSLSSLLSQLGALLGAAIDLPLSPVRLVLNALPEGLPQAELQRVRSAAGISYLVSLLTLGVFALYLRGGLWPGRGSSFNVWVNLPTFDPTAGPDVVYRLERDAKVNILLGFLLPFLLPLILTAASTDLPVALLGQPQLLVWVVAAWSFLPASLFMRGIAMNRIAAMIRAQRLLAGAPERQLLPA